MTILSLLISIVINGLVPFLLYTSLKHVMPSLPALIIATLAPLLENIFLLLKRKTFDIFGLMMLGSIVLSIALASMGGDEKLVLLRESFVTVAIGCCFIVSLFLRRPLIYHLSKRFLTGMSAEQLEERWEVPYFRFGFRLITLVWGVLLLAEAAVRVVLVYQISVELFLVISSSMLYGTIGCAAIWTMGYRRYARKKYIRIHNK
ncbi:VC0807 family protein [Paenibacillus castaneae]